MNPRKISDEELDGLMRSAMQDADLRTRFEAAYELPREEHLRASCRRAFFLDLCVREGIEPGGLSGADLRFHRVRTLIAAMNALAREGELDTEWETVLAEALEDAAEAGVSDASLNALCKRQTWLQSLDEEE